MPTAVVTPVAYAESTGTAVKPSAVKPVVVRIMEVTSFRRRLRPQTLAKAVSECQAPAQIRRDAGRVEPRVPARRPGIPRFLGYREHAGRSSEGRVTCT